MQQRILHPTTRDYYLETLSTQKYIPRSGAVDMWRRNKTVSPEQRRFHSDPVQVANDILQEYNFIAISERLEESAVVLMLLLDIPMSDILFLNAKGHGRHYDDGVDGECKYMWPSFVTPSMSKVFASPEWKERIRYDQALYEAANRSLDLTIDHVIGRPVFEEHLTRYREAQLMARDACSNVSFPCTETGLYLPPASTDCLWKDSGCGTKCLDKIAGTLGL
jgi:hypothetical protein